MSTCVPLKASLTESLSLLVGVAVDAPAVLFGADDEVLGTQFKFQSISAVSVRHEDPSLALLNFRLHTCGTAKSNRTPLRQVCTLSGSCSQNWI